MQANSAWILKDWFSDPKRRYIFLDADDTIWHDGRYFQTLREVLLRLCSVNADEQGKIIQVLNENVKSMRLGEREYVKAIRKTAENAVIDSERLSVLNSAIEAFLKHDIELLPRVEDALSKMGKYKCILLTKGCKNEQLDKLRRSQLAKYFHEVHVLERKEPSYLEGFLMSKALSAHEVIVIGNSVRHDILPAVKVGAAAVWLNHSNNEHGRNENLPDEACEVEGWPEIVKILEDVENPN